MPTNLSSAWSASSLPPDVLDGSCKRVGMAGITFAVLWVFALAMYHLVSRLPGLAAPAMGPAWNRMFDTIAALGLVTSLGITWIAFRWSHRRAMLLDLALVYMVVTAGLVACSTYWEPQPNSFAVSWVAFGIVIYATLVPNVPRKILLAALLAASMDPLFMWLATARGLELPYTPYDIGWLIVPNYLAAAVAVIPSKIAWGLGQKVRQARQLGSYQLGDLIGRGGMGEVYRAEHRLLARPAAIKLIRPDLLAPELRAGVVERFRREAQAVAALSSPHTVSLYDFGVSAAGTFYYVMELLDGLDAEQLVERFGPQPPERVVHLLRQAARSLAEAHTKQLVHRDIKPSNVFVARIGTDHDFVKVLDFGLVRGIGGGGGDAREAARLTVPNAVAGTATYLAPELATGGEPDARADIYALGCVAYWLLTGKLVFDAPSPLQIMFRHATETPPAPSARSPFPDAARLDDLVLRLLAKNPDDRPPDAGEVVRLLDQIRFEVPWTPERAEAWWNTCDVEPMVCGPCNKGEFIPESTAAMA